MSSPTIYRPPFIRQVLPWIFVLVFFITAPLLIFYTSGYRYNFKKGLVERNGTLIIDSIPTGGTVFIDDRATGDRTPVTLQNMVPGWHTLRVERPSYSSWQENVLIRSERVTFANHIWLWRQSVPTLVWSGNAKLLNADPLREHALLISVSANGLQWRSWTPTGSSVSSILPNSSVSSTFVTRWSNDGQAALLEDTFTKREWWIHSVNGQDYAETLTSGAYHWAGSDLIGNTEKTAIRVGVNQQALVSTLRKATVLEQSQGLEIQSPASSTENRILLDDSFLTRRFSLPAGNWSFGEVLRPFVLLKDQNRWLALQIKFGQPYVESLQGDYPRWASQKTPQKALFLNGNEIWTWTMGEAPTLLWRQSDPLVQVIWHRSGDAIFVADQKQVFAINVEEGMTQTATPLASFDHITDMAIIGRLLYVAGERDRTSGIWELSVE